MVWKDVKEVPQQQALANTECVIQGCLLSLCRSTKVVTFVSQHSLTAPILWCFIIFFYLQSHQKSSVPSPPSQSSRCLVPRSSTRNLRLLSRRLTQSRPPLPHRPPKQRTQPPLQTLRRWSTAHPRRTCWRSTDSRYVGTASAELANATSSSCHAHSQRPAQKRREKERERAGVGGTRTLSKLFSSWVIIFAIFSSIHSTPWDCVFLREHHKGGHGDR